MLLISYVLFFILVSYAEGLTRYTCLTSLAGAGGGLASSEEESGLNSAMRGSLSCSTIPNTKILVTRIIHGYGNFRRCANPDESCDKEVYSDNSVAAYCDGKVSCFVQTFSQWLDKCSTMSDFVHVEYECVFDSSIFDICHETNKVVRDTSVYVVSPNVYQGSGTGSSRPESFCECIMNSRYSEQIMADYIHSDIYATGDKCSNSYILVESKLLPNQSTVDKELEVCGRRTVSNQMFRGSVRVTYQNKQTTTTDGFLAKFRVPPLEIGAEVRMQCGPVRAPGDYDSRKPPPTRGPGYNSFRGGSFNNNMNRQSPWSNGFNSMIPQFTRPPYPYFGPTFSPMYPPGPPGWHNPGTRNGHEQWSPWDSSGNNSPGAMSGPGSPWDNPDSGTGRSPWDSQNQPWSNEPTRSDPNLNDPSMQVPRDPRRFSPPPQTHSPPNADQLGIKFLQENSTSARNPTRMDPRMNMNNDQDPNARTDFIPWTNSNNRHGSDFIPWTQARSNKTNTIRSENIIADTKVERKSKARTNPEDPPKQPILPDSVQFLGTGKSMKMTDRQPADQVLNHEPDLTGISAGHSNQYLTANEEKSVSPKGSELAYIIGGVGAGLIGLCSVAFFFLCTKRRKLKSQKGESRDIEENSCESISDDPTYALPSDVSRHPPCSSHDNEAYVTDHDDPPYSSHDNEAYVTDHVEPISEIEQKDEIRSTGEEEEKNETEIFTVTLETQATQTYTDNSNIEDSIYDNNFENQ